MTFMNFLGAKTVLRNEFCLLNGFVLQDDGTQPITTFGLLSGNDCSRTVVERTY